MKQNHALQVTQQIRSNTEGGRETGKTGEGVKHRRVREREKKIVISSERTFQSLPIYLPGSARYLRGVFHKQGD